MKMKKSEIKKEIYKQNPVGKFETIDDGVAYWTCELNDKTIIKFGIPSTDVEVPESFCYSLWGGDLNEISARLLIRWLI